MKNNYNNIEEIIELYQKRKKYASKEELYLINDYFVKAATDKNTSTFICKKIASCFYYFIYNDEIVQNLANNPIFSNIINNPRTTSTMLFHIVNRLLELAAPNMLTQYYSHKCNKILFWIDKKYAKDLDIILLKIIFHPNISKTSLKKITNYEINYTVRNEANNKLQYLQENKKNNNKRLVNKK